MNWQLFLEWFDRTLLITIAISCVYEAFIMPGRVEKKQLAKERREKRRKTKKLKTKKIKYIDLSKKVA